MVGCSIWYSSCSSPMHSSIVASKSNMFSRLPPRKQRNSSKSCEWGIRSNRAGSLMYLQAMERLAFDPKCDSLSTYALGLGILILGVFLSAGSVKKYFEYLLSFISHIPLSSLISSLRDGPLF